MPEESRAEETREATPTTEEGKMVAQSIVDAIKQGNVPVKIVTGTQTSSGLNFDLKPGSIVAHENSTIVFVCG